jgi:hypothetical protein
MKHFKFNIGNSKQLFIAFTGAFSTWAATGFQRDAAHLSYVLLGFITGGLASHEIMENPNVMPPSHIMTPYVNNIKDSGSLPSTTYTPEGADIKKIIKINSGLLK